MSLRKYTNIDEINNRLTNVGEFIKKEDSFVVSQNEQIDSVFGECDTDILEFTVYDVNNNIVSQKDSKLVSYIKGNDINNYLIKTETKEFAVDVEKLLTNAGLTNGIFKVNIKFLRERLGSENELTRAFIQEISATREEIRILPLKVQSSEEITNKNIQDIVLLQKLDVDYDTYKRHIKSALNFSGENIVERARQSVDSRFEFIGGIDTFDEILREDFGITEGFSEAISKIYSEIRTEVLKELETRQGGLCTPIPSEELNAIMIGIIQKSINNIYLERRGITGESDINTTQESAAEATFETQINLSQTQVTENVQEYTTVNLSDIQLSASNVDNFDALLAQLKQQLSPVTPTPEETIPDTTTPTIFYTQVTLVFTTDLKTFCVDGLGKEIQLYIEGNNWETATSLYRDELGTTKVTSTTPRYYFPIGFDGNPKVLVGNTLTVTSCGTK